MSSRSARYLSGRVAIVTGGTRGIGFAIAAELAKAGADVVPTSRTESDVTKAVETIRSYDQESIAVTTDVSDQADVEELMSKTASMLGGVDILINNAGINPEAALGRPDDINEDAMRHTLDVNLGGVCRCVQTAAPYLRDSDTASVVNVASVGGVVGLPRQHPYVGSKHGVVGVTKSMALDWAPDIRVNALAPGYVATDLTAEVRENDKLRESIIDRTPMGRFADPPEIAGPAVFLASDDAAYITGECLTVDGGWTAR